MLLPGAVQKGRLIQSMFTPGTSTRRLFLYSFYHLHDGREPAARSRIRAIAHRHRRRQAHWFFPQHKAHRSCWTIVNHVCHRLAFAYCASSQLRRVRPLWANVIIRAKERKFIGQNRPSFTGQIRAMAGLMTETAWDALGIRFHDFIFRRALVATVNLISCWYLSTVLSVSV